MKCPKCNDTHAVKSGKVNSKQRYKCKSCGCNYTRSSLFNRIAKSRVACPRAG